MALRVAGPYQNADQAIVDSILEQVYYRGPGLVPTHIGVGRTHDAAVWLASNGRGGNLRWLVPGRVFLWTGIASVPGFSESETMSAVFAGSPLLQLNTAVSRYRGFLVQEARSRISGAG